MNLKIGRVNQFNKLSQFVKDDLGIDVRLGQITAFMGHKNKTIFIHHNHNLKKNGLYTLLHEVGHAYQNKSENHFKQVDEDRTPKKFSMYKFMNEVNAWDKGLQIAKELNIKVDENQYNKLKEESLLTYYVNKN